MRWIWLLAVAAAWYGGGSALGQADSADPRRQSLPAEQRGGEDRPGRPAEGSGGGGAEARRGAGAGDGPLQSEFERAGGSLFRMEAARASGAGGGGGATGTGRGPTGAEVSLFAVRPPTPRVLSRWDLITVIVREQSEASTAASTELSKQADINMLLEQYIRLSLSELTVRGRPPLANPPQIRAQARRGFSGEGTVDRSDSMTARVQAQVIDVKPNGVLVIQASRVVRHDEEEVRIVLTGMVRAEDVTLDNSVLSTQLADLVLEKQTSGAARDASRRGFIPRLVDRINPF